MLLFNTTRAHGPPRTGVAIAMDGGMALNPAPPLPF